MTTKNKWKPKVEYRNPKQLVPYAKNHKIHSDDQINKVAGSIASFGFTQPIVIDKEGVIIAGHCRREAAIRLALDSVPVVIADHLTEYEVMAARIADNKVSEAPWDKDMLKFDLGTLNLKEFKMDLTGFDLPEIKSFLDNDEPMKELRFDVPRGTVSTPAEPAPVKQIKEEKELAEVPKRVSLGQVWQLGVHRLICGSAKNLESVSKLLGANTIDLIFTDPPYGVKEEGNRLDKGRDGATKTANFANVIGDESEETAYVTFQTIKAINTKIIYWGANNYSFLPKSRGWIVWDKRENKGQDDNGDAELAWTNFDKPIRVFYHLWKGMIKASERGEKRVHPTQKPVALAEWCFENYGNPKTVLDLFGGSGSTLIACENTKRTCFMMELDSFYCDVIIARWEQLTGQRAVHIQPASLDNPLGIDA